MNINDFLIHERNLDDDLKAKINGIKQGCNVDLFSNYVNKKDYENEIEKIKQQIASQNKDASTYNDRTFLKKGEYDPDKVAGNFSANITKLSDRATALESKIINNINKADSNNNEILILKKDMDNLKKDMTNFLSNIEQTISLKVAEILNTNSHIQSQMPDSIKNDFIKDINNLKLAVAANKDNITNVNVEMKKVEETLRKCRKKEDKITMADLNSDLNTSLGNAAAVTSGLAVNAKSDEVLYASNDKNLIVGSPLVISGAYAFNNNDVEYLKKRFVTPFTDVYHNLEYSYNKYAQWNSLCSYFSADAAAEDTITAYQKIPIDWNTYNDKLNKRVKRFVAEGKMWRRYFQYTEVTDSNFMVYGFYGTGFKLYSKTMPQGGVYDLNIIIDGNIQQTGVYDTNKFNGEKYLFGVNGLSKGRHTLFIIGKEILAPYIFLDPHAVPLKDKDTLISFDHVFFDKQDNFKDMKPGEYDIVKDSSLFDASTVNPNDIYITKADTSLEGCKNRILYSNLLNKPGVYLGDTTVELVSEYRKKDILDILDVKKVLSDKDKVTYDDLSDELKNKIH